MASRTKGRRDVGAYGSFLCTKCAAAATKQAMLDGALEAVHHACLAALLTAGADMAYGEGIFCGCVCGVC